MAIWDLAKRLVKPITDIVDKAVKDKDLAEQLKHKIERQLIDSINEELKAKRDIIVAEAQGESWLQRSWRPITMLSFLVILFIYWLGLAPQYAVQDSAVLQEVFNLLKIGIGGYIVGRSTEKGIKEWKKSEQ